MRKAMVKSVAAVALGIAVPTAVGGDVAAPCQVGGVPVPGFAVTELGPEVFRTLHAAVAPRGQGERWTEIPWQTDLETARRQAAREGKPLLMWVMDGHPLGCT
jgi:hypothetical protein